MLFNRTERLLVLDTVLDTVGRGLERSGGPGACPGQGARSKSEGPIIGDYPTGDYPSGDYPIEDYPQLPAATSSAGG